MLEKTPNLSVSYRILSCLFQLVCAGGMFEVQIRQFQNPVGLLQNGECCDLLSNRGQRCPVSDQCDTFFRACLKEYQARVAPTGTCTFGSGSTAVLGGNTHSLRHHTHDGGEGSNGRISIPFLYAWPVSTIAPLITIMTSVMTSQCPLCQK